MRLLITLVVSCRSRNVVMTTVDCCELTFDPGSGLLFPGRCGSTQPANSAIIDSKLRPRCAYHDEYLPAVAAIMGVLGS